MLQWWVDMPKTRVNSQTTTVPGFRFHRFWLFHLFYAVTLLAASLSAFGRDGLAAGVYVLLIWAALVFMSERLRMLAVAIIVIVAVMHIGSRPQPSSYPNRLYCGLNVLKIAMALDQYHNAYGSYPPAYATDKEGKPRHSWRVLLLPFLGEQALYNEYDFTEPWDGPRNRILLDQRPMFYACPSHSGRREEAETFTHYVAVVGPRTVWPGSVGRKSSDISDSPDATVLVVEATGPGIPWTKPQDLTVDEAIPILTSVSPEQTDGHRVNSFFSAKFLGRTIAMVDGYAHHLPGGLARDVWLQLLSVDDGADVSLEELSPVTPAPRKLKLGNWLRLGLWIIIAIIPLPWAFCRVRRR